jgi:ferredoxin
MREPGRPPHTDPRATPGLAVRLRVNPIQCVAHGLCAELLPEAVRLDDWGYPILDDGELAPELAELARRAADACPTLALLLESERSG